MITISNDIFQSKYMSVQKLANKELPLKISKVLLKTLKELREGQKEFELDRLNLAKKYATLDKKGKPKLKDGKYTFTPDNEAKFLKEHESLIKKEREYDIELIKLPEDFNIAAADLLLLNGVVIEL